MLNSSEPRCQRLNTKRNPNVKSCLSQFQRPGVMDVTNHLSSTPPSPSWPSLKGRRIMISLPSGGGQGGGGLSEFFSRRLSRWGRPRLSPSYHILFFHFRQNEFDTSSSCIEATLSLMQGSQRLSSELPDVDGGREDDSFSISSRDSGRVFSFLEGSHDFSDFSSLR